MIRVMIMYFSTTVIITNNISLIYRRAHIWGADSLTQSYKIDICIYVTVGNIICFLINIIFFILSIFRKQCYMMVDSLFTCTMTNTYSKIVLSISLMTSVLLRYSYFNKLHLYLNKTKNLYLNTLYSARSTGTIYENLSVNSFL